MPALSARCLTQIGRWWTSAYFGGKQKQGLTENLLEVPVVFFGLLPFTWIRSLLRSEILSLPRCFFCCLVPGFWGASLTFLAIIL